MSSRGRSAQSLAIVFATTGFTALRHMIGGTKRTRAALESSHLGLVTGSERTHIPGDLITVEPFTCRFEWNQSMSVFPPITSVAETVTITWPLRLSETTGATLAGTLFLIGDAGPDVEVNASGVMSGEITCQWDGLTGPTYTAGS